MRIIDPYSLDNIDQIFGNSSKDSSNIRELSAKHIWEAVESVNFLKFLNNQDKQTEIEGSMRTEEYEDEGEKDPSANVRLVGTPIEDLEYEVFKLKHSSDIIPMN